MTKARDGRSELDFGTGDQIVETKTFIYHLERVDKVSKVLRMAPVEGKQAKVERKSIFKR